MIDALLRIEEAALGLNVVALFVPGVLIASLGLLLWLGGQRYARLAAGLLGALTGAWVGLLISGTTEAPTGMSVGIGAIALAAIAVLMRRVLIIALAAVIFAAALGSGYLGYAMDNESFQGSVSELRSSAAHDDLDPPQTQGYDGAQLHYLNQLWRERQATAEDSEVSEHGRAMEKLKTTAAELRLSASENTGLLILWIVVGAIVGIVLAFLLGKLVMSLCCSVVGTTAIIMGMCMLVLAKGTPVISRLSAQPKVIGIVCIAMVLFGWIVQLLLGLGAKAKKAAADDDSEDQE